MSHWYLENGTEGRFRRNNLGHMFLMLLVKGDNEILWSLLAV